jgi:hypothetical protein
MWTTAARPGRLPTRLHGTPLAEQLAPHLRGSSSYGAHQSSNRTDVAHLVLDGWVGLAGFVADVAHSVPSPGNFTPGPSQIWTLDARFSAAATLCGCPRRYRPDDPLEIGVRSGVAVDRHMPRHVELQTLEVAEQHDRVVIHIRQVPSRGRRPVKVRIDHDLLLGEIDDRHVVAVVETIDVIELDRLIAIADRVAINRRRAMV